MILTWGLIGPGKGIEWAIRAMAHLKDMAVRPLYLIVGETHPKVREREGESYRTSLEHVTRSLGLERDVRFDATYHDRDTIMRLVDGATMVVLPYDNATQITSGVLAEAVTAGKPVVATSFPHAIELLGLGAGTVVPQRDPASMAAAVRAILTNPTAARRMSQVGLAWGRHATWGAVGARYRAIAHTLSARVAA